MAAEALRPRALRDGLLITGQQQHSGAETAELVMAARGEARAAAEGSR